MLCCVGRKSSALLAQSCTVPVRAYCLKGAGCADNVVAFFYQVFRRNFGCGNLESIHGSRGVRMGRSYPSSTSETSIAALYKDAIFSSYEDQTAPCQPVFLSKRRVLLAIVIARFSTLRTHLPP
ncbi:hypothetical protein K491DRAFT_446858 [Lophiostoma macrostomum CBS 122681]|uniref:Uncharacterized protein n=1 Tax=Lophiostoma macrostomum CBS 122681 TaxID=1314788 RepID=A0A6A6T4M1_9PLEO|nr:hypothetical protein K491DRAFT_446858 [Lophiostoma macrostomum CBS 122681]